MLRTRARAAEPGSVDDQRRVFMRVAINSGCSFTEAAKKHASLPETLARKSMRAEGRAASRAARELAQAEARKRREHQKSQRKAQREAAKKARLQQHSANEESGQEQGLETGELEGPSMGQWGQDEVKRRSAADSEQGKLHTS